MGWFGRRRSFGRVEEGKRKGLEESGCGGDEGFAFRVSFIVLEGFSLVGILLNGECPFPTDMFVGIGLGGHFRAASRRVV